jgi:hypothetical protein
VNRPKGEWRVVVEDEVKAQQLSEDHAETSPRSWAGRLAWIRS